jgi:hypothetical protein
LRILDFFRGSATPPPPNDELRELVARLFDTLKKGSWHYQVKPADIPVCREVLELSPNDQAALLPVIAAAAAETFKDREQWQPRSLLGAMAGQMLRRKLPISEATLIALVERTATLSVDWFFVTAIPIAPLLGAVEDHVAAHGMSGALRSALTALWKRIRPDQSQAEHRKSIARVEEMLNRGAREESPLEPGDLWANAALKDYGAMDAEQRGAWRELFRFARLAPSKPTKKWLKQAKELIDAIGVDAFRTALENWLPAFDRHKDRDPGSKVDGTFRPMFIDANIDALRGLIFAATLIDDPSFPPILGDLAERAFHKVPGIGAMAPKIGNACVIALSELGTAEATGQLSRLRSRVKAASASNVIERAFNAAAERAGLTADDLEELYVPTFGMNEPGVLRRTIGEAIAEVSFDDFSISWLMPNGKRQSSVPAAIKSSKEVKELKKQVGEIETMFAAQRERLDGLYLARRDWTYAQWKARYLDHPLVGTLARRLIWKLTYADRTTATALWSDGAMRDANGNAIAESERVALWHPIDSTADAVLSWRKRLEELQVVQPFKQAHREIYVITDAELQTDTYSNRFAAHILRQHQFAALARDRRWRYSLQGEWDSHNTPVRALPAWDLSAEYRVDAAGNTDLTEAGISLYVATDQVRFVTAHGAVVSLAEVPPIVFSEIMRHVDLFVGVASIGNDPAWRDGGNDRYDGYWTNYAFGELSGSATTRRAILQSLVPRLKIADRCSIADRFLIVRGDLRTYKIHLGSTNILMEPNDQYLCIVPTRGAAAVETGKLYVPFEGDSTLSLIVSKAFLLANDRKITDPTIVSQLKR